MKFAIGDFELKVTNLITLFGQDIVEKNMDDYVDSIINKKRHAIIASFALPSLIERGLGETFDYLNIGIVAIMFQLLWDVAACEIFND